MFKILLKARLQSLKYSYFQKISSRKNRNNKAAAVGLSILFIYLIAVFFMMFFGLFMSIMKPLAGNKMLWLVFAIADMLIVTLCFFTTVFTTQAQLFEAKDNDMLIAMPIPPKYILSSRTVMLLMLNYAFASSVAIPLFVAYIISGFASLGGIICLLIEMLLIPLLAQTISFIVAFIVAKLTAKMRNKSVLTTVFSLIFLGLYFFFYSKMNNAVNFVVSSGAAIGSSVKSKAYLLYIFGSAVSDGNFLYLLIFIACSVIPFLIAYAVLTKSFIGIATAKTGISKKEFKNDSIKTGSASSALLRREASHFFQSTIYLMNCGLGVIFTVALPVVVIFKKASIMAAVEDISPSFTANFYLIAAIMICFLGSLTDISAPSVSLEGKNLWIVKSLPLSEKQILMSKIKLHIYINLPANIIAALIFAFAFKFNLWQTVLLIILPNASTVFTAFLGVFFNLKFPKLDWINETQPVKQGASVIFTLLASMAAVSIPVLLYMFLLASFIPAALFVIIYTAYFAALSFALYRFICTKGAKIFREL